MKKNLAKKVTLSILAGAVLMSSGVVWAGTVDVAPPGSGWIGIDVDSDSIIDIYAPQDSYNNSMASHSYNKVTLSTGADYGFAGGYSKTGNDPRGNNIKISSGGTFKGVIYGGYATQGGAFSNTVVIEGGKFNDNIFGGYSALGNAGGEEANDGNAVTITNGMINGDILGGFSGLGNATRNTVTISGENTIGGYVYGGYSVKGNAISNTVTISGGTVSGTVIGGFSKNGNAEGNTVTISGGTVSGNVAGGYSDGGDGGDATGNTVNISGTANLENANLYGGYGYDAGVDDDVVKYGGAATPNTLNIGINEALLEELDPAGEDGKRKYGLQVGAWNNKKVKSIQGFDVINFYNLEWNNGNTIVETEEAHLSPNGTKINVHVASGNMNLNESMTLIKSVSDITGKVHDDSKQPFEIFEGVDKVYEGQISQPDNKSIIVKIVGEDEVPGDDTGDNTGGGTTGGDDTGDNTGGGTGGGNTGGETGGDNSGEGGNTTPQPSRNDQVLVLGESRAAAVAFTNQGSELIETGLNALARDNEKDTKVFAAVYGNHSEYETGSHVNVNGWSGIVGIGKTNDNGLTVGAFFENGEGNYSTHNIFTDDYIRGDGEACYNGGGFLVRKDNANGIYAEASLRAGNLQNELRNAVRNGSELTGYDIDTFYYGAHVGIGKVIARGNDGDSLDVYGKFIYTHHDGETFDIGGTATKFDSVESERLRLGFRINEVQTNKLSMYYGAAWEYEFNGDAHDKIASFDLETPSLEGSTVIGEIGAHYKASDKWSIDLNGRAYVGQREGFSGSVQANYAF